MNQQIITLYEVEGLTVEEIAKAMNYEPQAVRMALMGGSSKFRKAAKTDESLFTEDDMSLAKTVMAGLLYSEESDHIKFRAARFIINEKKGRHDAVAKSDMNININLINVHMEAAEKALQAAKNKPTIDVPAEMAQ